jgi:hypothetical protein
MAGGNSKAVKVKFNWIDVIVLVLAAALILMFVLDFLPNENKIIYVDKKVTVEITIQIDKLSNDIDIDLASGDEVLDVVSKEKLGVLSSNPMIVPFQENIPNEVSGGIEVVYSDSYSSVYLTIVAEADESEYGYFVNNSRVAVGKEYEIRISGLEAVGTCISVELQ